jgi:LuxR family maltose regulon positive regulatory protein
MGLNLSVDEAAALEKSTEGWIAGLQLAALSMQGRADGAGFIKAFTGSHRYVLDYLVEEVLQRQPERVHSFLLQTALLDGLTGSLCDAVTGQEDGQGMLDTLERGNLFVVPLDEKRQWYRYHRLFADVLQARLTETLPDQIPDLHRRAGAWYEQNGLRPDAIHHALAGGDFERAAGLIELAWPKMEETIQKTAVWLGWVRTLPDELVRARPVLSVGYAAALMGGGEMEAAEARLKDAERWLEAVDSTPGSPEKTLIKMVVVDEAQFRTLPATIAVARAYHAQALGDVPGTVKHARRALDLLPEGDRFRREQATALLGITYWASGNLEAADRIFADYSMKLRMAGNIPDAISSAFVLADIRMALGRLRGAVGTHEQLLKFIVDHGEPIPPDAADLYRGLGDLCRERGDLDAAVKNLQRSKELGGQAELPVWRYRWCIAQARLLEAQGDRNGAFELLEEAERLFIRTPLPDLRPISAMKARIWIAQGRLDEASAWAHECGLSVEDGLSYLREFEHLTLARLLIARYRSRREEISIGGAKKLLERLLNGAEADGRMGSVIEILLQQALAHQAQGDIPRALAPLARALSLAEPEGCIRIFADEGPPMARLLQEAASRGIAPEYSRKILEAFAPADRLSAGQPEGKELLSEREREVLQFIAEGLSNREIADRLCLSLYTVKAHARTIYDKLDAHNRTQAVARARELGALPRR